MLMVIVHTLLCWLAAYVYFAVMFGEIKKQKDAGLTSNGWVADLLFTIIAFTSKNIFLSVEAFVAIYGSSLLTWFALMHLRNIYYNRTTNEQYKVSELRNNFQGKVLSFKAHLETTEDKIKKGDNDFKRFKFEG